MMNKSKSGLPAKLKATLVAPFAILIFFLFADFTLKGSESKTNLASEDLQGLWIGQTEDGFSPYLMINGDLFSFTEGVEIRSFKLRFAGDKLILSRTPETTETSLKYEYKGDRLILWWNDTHSSHYIRSSADNTLDQLLMESGLKLDLPFISQYRLMEDESRLYRLSMGKKASGELLLTFDGEPLSIDMLPDKVNKARMKLNKIDQSSLTALFLVDRKVPMQDVKRVREVLRKMEALRIAEGGYPQGDLSLSPLIYHAVALPRLLPPLHAKILNKEEVEKFGTELYTIDLAARNTTPRDMDDGLRDFIGSNDDGKYIISLEYDGAIPYGQYVEAVDMVWKIVYSFRNSLAMERYSVPYDKLGDDLQRKIRKAYPMALTEMMK